MNNEEVSIQVLDLILLLPFCLNKPTNSFYPPNTVLIIISEDTPLFLPLLPPLYPRYCKLVYSDSYTLSNSSAIYMACEFFWLIRATVRSKSLIYCVLNF